MAADVIEGTTCPECGGDPANCGDRERPRYPQRQICYVRMATAAANRRYDEMHEDQPFHDGTFTRWSKEASDMTSFHYRDGVTIFVTDEDLTPEDDFVVPRTSDSPIL